jgi:putative ABC transport system permease protein
VSLLVGGIGIMNIMLVSVTERTREIGLRMAVGARGRDILTQFLVEALTVALIGGSVGVVAGLGASFALAYFGEWRTVVSPPAILLAFTFSGLIGIFFGFYPARKAAGLNPIDALRYE